MRRLLREQMQLSHIRSARYEEKKGQASVGSGGYGWKKYFFLSLALSGHENER